MPQEREGSGSGSWVSSRFQQQKWHQCRNGTELTPTSRNSPAEEEGGWGGCAMGSVPTADKKIQTKELSFMKCPKTLKSGTIIL